MEDGDVLVLSVYFKRYLLFLRASPMTP